jgi:Fe-S-cluster containining protein
MYPGTETESEAESEADAWRGLIRAWRSGCAEAAGPMALAEFARHAGALADAVTARIEAGAREGGSPISCRKGCAACCRQPIPLTPADAELIEERLAALPWDRRAEIDEGFRRGLAALDAGGLGTAPLLDRSSAYYALRIPCPFLSGEACSIHPERPLACREHLVTSPASECEDYPSPYIRPGQAPFSVAEASGEALSGGVGGDEWIPLVRLREWLSSRERRPVPGDGPNLLDRLARACERRLG